MPRSFDRTPAPFTDPNQGLEFHIGSAFQEGLDMWKAIIDALAEFAENLIKELIQKLLGLDVDPEQALEDLWNLLTGWVDDIPIVGDIVHIIRDFLNGNLFGHDGFILSNLIPALSFSWITEEQPNLLVAGNFQDGASIADNPYWSWASGVSHSADSSGSVKVTANGTSKALRSNEIIVNPTQTMSLEMWVKWSGYTGSGTPIKLQLIEFEGRGTNAVQVGLKDIATLNPLTSTGDWRQLAGNYTVPDGVQSVRVRILVTKDATGGVFNFDDGVGKKTNKIQMGWIDGLTNTVQEFMSRWQLVVDTVVNALGIGGALHSLEDLFEAILNIPSGNVSGVGGPGDIGASIQEFLSHLLGGISGSTDPSSNGGFGDLFNLSKLLATAAALGEDAFQILSIRNNTPVNTGLLPSGTSNYGLTSVNTTLSATQSASLIATMRVERDIALGVVSWMGCGTSGITAFYVNIWKLDGVSGDWALVHHSPNILSELTAGATPNWTFYQLDTPVDQKAGETYAYELVPVGGTHSVRGISTTDDIPDHPFAQVVGLAATRNNTSSPNTPPSSIAKASVVRSGNIPWIETAIDTGNGVGYYDPISVYVVDSGTVPIPSWVNFVDPVAVGGAGGGQMGLTLGFHGEPGSPGLFKATTWQRGVHFGDNAVLTFTKGVGGRGGRPGHDDGADGTASVWSIPDYSITAEPGVGGTELQLGSNPIGRGAGAFEYKGDKHVGGGDQKVPGRDGTSPGGAGNGGNGLTFQFGGNGADGAGWVRFRQNPLDGEEIVGGPGQVHVPGIESTASLGTPAMSGGLSMLPLEDQAAIDAIVTANITAPGGVLAIQSPDGYYRKAYGKKSTAAGALDMTLEDHFRIGSASKTFTQTMVLMAVDRGQLSLDDPLEKYIPGVPGGSKVTIRNMLTMRSGLFNEQTDMGMMLRYFLMPTSDWTDEETLAIVKAHELGFEPGSKFAYTNSNFILLGMILEKITGRKMREILKTDVLDPLGLTETSWPTDSKMPVPYPNGHAWATGIFGGGAWQDATETNPGYAGAAGAIISTAHDLLLWVKELRDGTLLSPEMQALRSECFWREPWTNDDQLTYFGYGHGMFQLGKWQGHAGSWRGYECSMYYLPNGTLFVMMENAQTPIVEAEVSLMYKIGKYLYPDSLDVGAFPNHVFGIPPKSSVGKPLFGNIDVKFDNKSAVGTSMAAIPEFTIGSDANIVFAWVSATGGTDLSGMSAKIGGVTMNRLPDVVSGTDRIIVFWLLDPPTGAQSIKFGNPSYGISYATGAASYKLAAPAGIGTPVVATGTGTTASVSATSHVRSMVVNAFLYGGQTATYSQTERGHVDAAPFANRGLIFGDAPGGSVTFTQTLTASAAWIGIAIPIISNAE